MNEKTKLFRNLLFLSLFSYLLVLISCNEDLEEIDGTHFGRKHGNNVKILTGNEAKLIFNQLVNESKNNKNFDILGNKLKINGKNSFLLKNSDQTTIDYSQIMQVSDLKGNVNYTFKVLNHPDDDENTFHNLVYNNQNTSSPRINLIKYDNVGANFKTSYNSTMTSASLVAASDPCPPVTTPINNNPGSDNPGGGNTVGGNTGGSIPVGGNPGGGNPGGGNPGGGNSGGNNGVNISYIVAPISISFQCNSCSFNSKSWQGFSSHRDDNGNLYDFTVIIFRTSTSPNTTIISNPCDTQGDIGVLPNLDNKKPCEELNKLNTSPSYEQTINYLKQKAEGNKEYAWAYKYHPNSTNFASPTVVGHDTSNPNTVDLAAFNSPEWLGAFHNHTNGDNPTIKMFSPADIKWLIGKAITLSNIQNAENIPVDTSHLFLGLVNVNQVYTLKIKDLASLSAMNRVKFIELSIELENKYKKLYKEANDANLSEPSQQKLQTSLLEVFKKFNIGMGLFKQGADNTWSELVLDNNNNVKSIPCTN